MGVKEIGSLALRELAETGGHRALASMARIIEALGYYAEQKPPAEDMEALESALAMAFKRLGVRMDATHTLRLLRPQLIGSWRVILAEQMLVEVERVLAKDLEDPRDEIAGWIAVCLEDWPATPALKRLSTEEITKLARAGLRGRPTDAESIVRAALRGIGTEALGITETQLRNLYSYKTKREDRDR